MPWHIPVRFSVTGAGELAAQGNGSPNTPASFRAPLRRTFEGRCLVILRPSGVPGSIQLKAEAEGLEASQITVTTH
jgi:beta-galactosidase